MKPPLSLILLLLPLLLLAEAKEVPSPKPHSKPDPKMTDDFARFLTPEKCASQPPSWSFENYFADGNKAWKSEQGEDVFHEVYAEVLAKQTDAGFPEAVKFRKLLSKVSGEMLSFITQANGGAMTAREKTKLRAEVEWWISQGFDKDFDLSYQADYTRDDIGQLARLYQRTHAHHVKQGHDPKALEAKVLVPALAELEIGEREMSKQQALFFRAKLAAMIADHLGE